MGRNVELTQQAELHRKAFLLRTFGEGVLEAVTTKNVHGADIRIVTAADVGQIIDSCDGLFTTTPNLPIMVTHQDCVSIVISDDAASFVCVLHAGWRGVLADILPTALRFICKDRSAETVRVYLGPSILSCHFEVQNDVADEFFEKYPFALERRGEKQFVDLFWVLESQAVSCGLTPSQISSSPDCTYHNSDYFSWRRDGVRENNMITAAMLRE